MPSLPDDRDALLWDWRRSRFANGLICPRCSSSHVVRWGTFSGRLRFRCRGCSRTFSDLTGSPAAYCKKIELLSPYARSLAAALTIRAAARATGVAPSTAFRWRHRLLGGLVDHDHGRLSGWVELTTRRFDRSLKGQRRIPRPPRTHQSWPGPSDPICVLVALDRRCQVATYVVPHRIVRAEDLATLDARLDAHAALLADEAPSGAVKRFAIRSGRRFVDVRQREGGHLANVTGAFAYARDFARWLPRFRGVATRYLQNYLAWHRAIEFTARHHLERVAFRWALHGARPESTVPENRTTVLQPLMISPPFG